MSLSTLPYKYDESNYKQKQHSWSICKLKNLIKIEKRGKNKWTRSVYPLRY